MLLVMLLGQGCVTTSTGGFNAQASEERALENYLQLAVGYLEQGDLTNAKRHLANAAEINDNTSELHGIWGLIYTREGDLELADESFRRAIRLNGDNSQARNNYAAFLFANGRFEEAYEQLQEVVEDVDYEARASAFENLGLAALRLDRLEDAEYAFGRALQLNPNQLRSSLELSELNLRKGDILQARAYYRNYQTLMQFYQVGHSARSLWIGIQVEEALGNEENAAEYVAALESRFADSLEYQLYLQSLNDE